MKLSQEHRLLAHKVVWKTQDSTPLTYRYNFCQTHILEEHHGKYVHSKEDYQYQNCKAMSIVYF